MKKCISVVLMTVVHGIVAFSGIRLGTRYLNHIQLVQLISMSVDTSRRTGVLSHLNTNYHHQKVTTETIDHH